MKNTQELTLKIEDLEERIAPHFIVDPSQVGGNGEGPGHANEQNPAGLATAAEHSPVIVSTHGHS